MGVLHKPPLEIHISLKLRSHRNYPPTASDCTGNSLSPFRSFETVDIPTDNKRRTSFPGRVMSETRNKNPVSVSTSLPSADLLDFGHCGLIDCSFCYLLSDNLIFMASLSIIRPNTSVQVSRSDTFFTDERGGSPTSCSPSKRKWSDTHDYGARTHRRPFVKH